MTNELTAPITADGRCLCGDVQYHIEGESFGIIYCHCQRCRKQTGAALIGFVILEDGRITWKSGEDLVHRYKSDITTRSFCSRCGSSAPVAHNNGHVGGVTAGSLVDMDPPIDIWHLFRDSKTPWYEIPTHLKQYPTVGEGHEDHDPCLPNLDRHTEPDRITGSCLCGKVSYAAKDPMFMMNCHCTRCRYSRAAPHATNLFVALDDFEWLSGEDNIECYKVPDAERFTACFCVDCGSRVPTRGTERFMIPAGGLDSDPGIKPMGHIYVGSKARWFEIEDDLPQWEELPT